MVTQSNPTRQRISPKAPPLTPVELPPLDDQPLVSIVVPSFNQGQFIGDTIRSILDQSYRPLEIHVIDGASTDQTVDVLKGFADHPELNWVSEPDGGVVEAVNKGFARVRGQIIGIQSSDDFYKPGAVETMVGALKSMPDHGLLYADMETVDAEGRPLFRSDIRPYTLRDFLRKQTWIPQPTAFFRREMLDQCGGWDQRYFSADTELWMRMAFRTNVAKLDKCIASRRRHDEQRNHQIATIAQAYRNMVADSEDLRVSSPELRRAAKAGTHIHSIRYNESGSSLRASLHLWQALMIDPSLWRNYKRSPLIVPGWLPFRGMLSSFKRRILGESSRDN